MSAKAYEEARWHLRKLWLAVRINCSIFLVAIGLVILSYFDIQPKVKFNPWWFIFINLFSLIVSFYAIWFVWEKMQRPVYRKVLDTIILLLLGAIGQLLWIPVETRLKMEYDNYDRNSI